MTKHRRDVHPVEVEGCFGCKIGNLQFDLGAAKSNGVPHAKEHDKELGSYYDALRQGIEPVSTKKKILMQRYAYQMIWVLHSMAIKSNKEQI